MKRLSISIMTVILFFGLVMSTDAVLIDRGGGMIYSTELNVTWLQDAKYARTSGYDAVGRMTWDAAMEWAENLTYAGYDDWRLPTSDPSHPGGDGGGSKLNEMAYLIYTELVNSGYPHGNYGPFINAEDPGVYGDDIYWTSTEIDYNRAWNYYLECG